MAAETFLGSFFWGPCEEMEVNRYAFPGLKVCN